MKVHYIVLPFKILKLDFQIHKHVVAWSVHAVRIFVYICESCLFVVFSCFSRECLYSEP